MRYSEINITRFAWDALPSVLRGANMYALLVTLLMPVETVFNAFLNFRSAIQYKHSFNAQTMYLTRFIQINVGAYGWIKNIVYSLKYVYMWTELTEFDYASGKVGYLRMKEENEPFTYKRMKIELDQQKDFVVMTEGAMNENGISEAEVRQLVDQYNVAGMTYEVDDTITRNLNIGGV
jgi:hypothetical protein